MKIIDFFSTQMPHRIRIQHYIYAFISVLIILQTIGSIDRFADGRIWDWGHFYYAAQALTNAENPFLSGERGYIYPVFFAWLIQPLTYLGFESSAAVSISFMGACAIGSLFFLQRLLVQSDHIPKTVSFALLIAFILTADKFVSTLKNAQTDLLLIALFSIALYHYRKSVIITALCLAFAASIKYHALLFLVLFLFRRQWKAAGLTFLFFWILLLLPALTVGWNTNLTYIQDAFSGVLNMFMNIESNRTGEVTDIAAAIEPISWVRSISLTSAMARLNDMLPETLSLVTPLIFLGVLGGACFATIKSYKSNGINALGAQTKLQEGQRVSPVDICDWSIVLILLVILAPQSTARHFIFMFIPLCALSYGALRTTEKGLRYLTWSLLIAFAVTLNMPLSEYPNLMDAWRSFSIPSWIMLALLILLPRLYLSPSLSGKREDDTAEQEKPYE